MRIGKLLIATLIIVFSSMCHAVSSSDKAILLHVTGAIGPATQDYLLRGFDHAKTEKAKLIIIQLNTPGGLETAMRKINEAIMTSPIPVVVYVAPAGARAASAGTYLLYASHIAAMAPGTNVGAASPVSLMPTNDGDKKAISTEMKKATNDAAAYLNSLAEMRGRNADWAKAAVNQAASISAEQAKKLNVIDVIAENVSELLSKIDGKIITIHHAKQTLASKHLSVETITPGWRHEFLSFITNPNIAYLLMLLAMYGIFFELANPGSVLPGVAGVIALLIVLYAFQLMPINYTGLALVGVGIAFIVLELFVASYGVLGIGGVIAFIVGSIMLFDTNNPDYRVMLWLIILMSTLTALFFLLLLTMAIRSYRYAITTGKEGLIGSKGVVINANSVRVHGEIWQASASDSLRTGDIVKVTKVNGLTITVEPIQQEKK